MRRALATLLTLGLLSTSPLAVVLGLVLAFDGVGLCLGVAIAGVLANPGTPPVGIGLGAPLP